MGKLNWNPWMAGSDPRRVMDLLRSFLDGEETPGLPGLCWQPQADVYETAQGFVVQVDLPGLAREDVVVEARGGEIWIYGSRRFFKEGGAEFHVLERPHGPFARKIRFPEEIDADRIAAALADGLLTVTVPRARPAASRRIEVSVSD